MAQLVLVTSGALARQEEQSRDFEPRSRTGEALRLLREHEAALIKAYPMALLEIFAEGPAGATQRKPDPTGLDFGELSLMDYEQMHAQVELSRAQQMALHVTDTVLADLNALVSAAQGLQRVQPERNPLRPENYIRALQQVVLETGTPAPVREAWMQSMLALLGEKLVDVYKHAAQGLRDHGIEPAGYGVVALPGMGVGGRGDHGGAYGAVSQTGYGSMADGLGARQGHPYAYGGGMAAGWSDEPGPGTLAPEEEEALLTVGILRQMLAGGGDPYAAVAASHSAGGPAPSGSLHPTRVDPHGVVTSAPSPNAAAAEAMEDIAQLERLVGRLAQGQPGYLPAGQGPGVVVRAQAAVPGGEAQSHVQAAEVVVGMVANIAQDARLLPAVRLAVQSLEPALLQLVRHDARFFSDSHHPARRLLDELTQRSLVFQSEDAPGFSRFMRLVNEAVGHLADGEITNDQPFETVLKALQAVWDEQEQKLRAEQMAQYEEALQATSLSEPEPAVQAELVPEASAAPEDDGFVIGAWVELLTNRKVMRTQLTWTSPHKTLFLFTAADGSTQSMTKRMRDRLLAEGTLRFIPGPPAQADTKARPGGRKPGTER